MNLAPRHVLPTLRRSLTRKGGRQAGVFLFFLAVSAGFWLLQALNETREVHIVVPLRLTHRPGDVIVLTEPPEQFTVSVKDKGIVLWHYLFKTAAEPLNIAFDDVSRDRTAAHVRISSKQLWDSLSTRFPSSTQLMSVVSPDSITLDYNRGQHVVRPARFAGLIEAAPHFALSSLTLHPSMLKVYALTERATSGDTVDVGRGVRLTGLKQSGKTHVSLHAPEGVSYSPDHMTLSYTVEPLMKRTLRIPVSPQNFPGGKALRTFPSHVSVTYWVRPSDAEQPITPDSFFLSVTYDEVLRGSEKLRPRLHVHPRAALDITLAPRTVDYLIEEVEEE